MNRAGATLTALVGITSAAKETRLVSRTPGHEDPAGVGTDDPRHTGDDSLHGGDASAALELGQRIREVRRKKRMTLRDAADAAEVSESFLSQVERGLANPSVASLRRIADAMHEPVASFFVGDAPTGMLVRAKDRRRLVHPMGMLEDYLLTPPTARRLQIIYCVAGPGEGSGQERYTHVADEECLVVLSGSLEVGIGDETYELNSGDALLLDPKNPHGFYNRGSEPCTMLWVQTPPLF
jgi:transcriptional regulator with XRE-family HTH domain